MIFPDKRERNSIVPTQLENLKVPLTYQMLDVGDYIISGSIDICAERKAIDDYVSSLISGRLNNELYNMSFNYPINILIVEGYIEEVLIERKIKRQSYLANLAGVLVKRSPEGESGFISIVMVSNPYDTALLLKYLHDRVTEEDGLVRLPRAQRMKVKPEKRVLYVASSLPTVSEKRGKDLLIEFKTLRNLANATIDELTEVSGIGGKTARKIYNIFNKEFKEEER